MQGTDMSVPYINDLLTYSDTGCCRGLFLFPACQQAGVDDF